MFYFNACVFFFFKLQLWDATNGKCVATITGHDDEILDSCFDYTGKFFATSSADGRKPISAFS